MKRQTVILTLGAHRSGTSAISRILNLLGVELGSDLQPAGPYNERGFWENMKFTRVHDKLLEALGASWDSIGPLPDRWWTRDVVKPFIQEIKDLIDAEFSAAPIWCLKDPRLCRVLPIWLPLLRRENYRTGFVFISRHPSEVVRSLCFRDQFSLPKGYLLWLRHVLEGEQWSREFKRVFITYEQLLRDWQTVVRRVVNALDIPEPRDRVRFAGDVESFVSAELRHQRVLNQELSEIDPLLSLVEQAHVALREASDSDGVDPAPALEKVAKQLVPIEREVMSLVDENESVFQEILGGKQELEKRIVEQQEELRQRQDRLAERDAQLKRLNDRLVRIVSSKSWRLTEPLRQISKSLSWIKRIRPS